jgi:hypothetical protein
MDKTMVEFLNAAQQALHVLLHSRGAAVNRIPCMPALAAKLEFANKPAY